MFELNLTEWVGRGELQNKIGEAKDPIVVLMAAKWCGYCSRFLQQLGSFNPAINTRLVLTDVDEPDESLWDLYRIRLVPTLIVFHQGVEIFRRDGKPGVGLRIADLEEALDAMRSDSK